MPTVIDSLVVLLKLDPSEFSAGQKKAAADLGAFADKAGAAFEKTAEKQKRGADAETRQRKERLAGNKAIAESYAAITDSVLGWATAVFSTAAIVDFAKNTTQMDASLGRFSERLSLNQDQLALWVGAVAHFSGSTQTAAKDVMTSADALNNIRFQYSIGDVSKTGVVQALGLSMADLQDPLAALDKLHQHVLAMQMSGRNATPLLRQLGITDNTISLLEDTAADYGKVMAAAQANVPATKASMKAAEDANAAWGDLDSTITGLANSLLVELLPAFTGAVKGAQGMAQQTKGPMAQFTSQVEGMLNAFAKLGMSTSGDGSLNLFGRAAVAIFGGVHIMLMQLGTVLYGLVGGLTTLANAAGAAASGDLKGVIAAFRTGGAGVADQWAQNVAKTSAYAGAVGNTVWTGQAVGPSAGPAAGSGGGGATPAPKGGLGGSPYGSPYQNAAAYFSRLLGGRKVIITEGAATSGHARNSEHYTGDAWDFKVPGLSNAQVIALIRATGVPFDELFDEQNHVHMGFRGARGKLGRGFGTNVSVYGHDTFGGAQSAQAGDTHIHVGSVTVNTKATDAQGIAKDLVPAMVAQAGRGLT
jgi:hypothetical protein